VPQDGAEFEEAENTENCLVTSSLLQDGHSTLLFPSNTSVSNFSLHFLQTYSNMGIYFPSQELHPALACKRCALQPPYFCPETKVSKNSGSAARVY